MTVPVRFLIPFAFSVSVLSFQAPYRSFASTSAPPSAKVVLQPSDDKGNAVPGSGYFQITAAPGSRSQLYALVGNGGGTRFTAAVVPVDAKSGVYGGISYNLPQQRRKHVGSWLKLSVNKVAVHPGRAALVPFTVHVPMNTPGGQYIGGLTAYVPVNRSGAKGPDVRGAGSIILQLRRVVAVVVTVPGQSYSRFTISHVNATKRPDAVYLIAHIRNTGTTLLKGQGNLWMWKQGMSKPVLKTPIAIDTTVPNTTVLYPVLWSKHPAPGIYHVSITVGWGRNGKTTRKSTFVWSAARR